MESIVSTPIVTGPLYSQTTLVALLIASAAGCIGTLDDARQLINAPRVLAVHMTPAEARPGESVELRAVVADPTGEAPLLRWEYCGVRRPLAATSPYAPTCAAVGATDERIVPLAPSPLAADEALRWTIPRDACRRFGPEPPPREPGQPPGRPVDPDTTGGFGVPVRVAVVGTDRVVLTGLRVTCAPAAVTLETGATFRGQYSANANPSIRSVRWAGNQGAVGGQVAADTVLIAQPGERVVVGVAWPECPTEDRCGDGICGPTESVSSCDTDCSPAALGCRGAERFLVFDVATRGLSIDREAMRVSYYSTAGWWREYALGANPDEDTTELLNEWTAPLEPGAGSFWFVLRDSRGGVDWLQLRWRVEDPLAQP